MISNCLIIHGPNLNLLGNREPQQYGTQSLQDINSALIREGDSLGLRVRCEQRNSESDLIDLIHDAPQDDVVFIIINPAAFTHTSVALRDALSAVQIPFIEVHLSNVHGREPFRRHSYFSDIAAGVIAGLGSSGYSYALHWAAKNILPAPTTK